MNLLSIEKLLDQATRKYLIEGKTEYVFSIRFTENLRKSSAELEAQIRQIGFLKISAYKDIKEGTVRVGRPSEVRFQLEDLKKLRPEIIEIRKAWENSLEHFKGLSGFLDKNYAYCIRKPQVIPSCVRILEYLDSNRPKIVGLFPRQIPHAESSKLIGKEPLLLSLYEHVLGRSCEWDDFFNDFKLKYKPYYFQFYSSLAMVDGLEIRNFHGLIGESNSNRIQFSPDPLVIVENEETFLALVLSNPRWNLLRGSGRAVASAGFLRQLVNTDRIYYWGDIDKDGYEIFANVQELFPNVQECLMDENTLKRFENIVQKVSETQPGSRPIPGGLQAVYERVCKEGLRLEQEKIPISLLFFSDEKKHLKFG